LVEAIHISIRKAVWIAMFQLFHYWIGRKLNLILKLEVATLNEQISHCCISFCRKFCQVHFCQILFKSVSISQCYHESLRGELFFETQCILFFTQLDSFSSILKKYAFNSHNPLCAVWGEWVPTLLTERIKGWNREELAGYFCALCCKAAVWCRQNCCPQRLSN